jgi:hypothetical protein
MRAIAIDTYGGSESLQFMDHPIPEIGHDWDSFDLALTLFSGRRAPERPGADRITREAYSHEVISCGFWLLWPCVERACY